MSDGAVVAGVVAGLVDIVGTGHVVTDPVEQAGYLTDWRRRYTGRARAVVRPASTRDVARVVVFCAQRRIPLVPQGGNTGLVGGATPDDSGHAVVLSTTRMCAVRHVDSVNDTITVEAGCTLAAVHEAASAIDRLFPLSLASEGSCTLGGNLSTNAGGTGVLRYGNTRELCLGIEAVLPDGSVVANLSGLRKDNTGYRWSDLLIGAEGTLGIVTAATMKLFAKPRAQVTAWAAVRSPRDAVALLAIAQDRCGSTLTAFELVSDYALSLIEKHVPTARSPFAERHPQGVLLEVSDHEDEQHARRLLESLLADALERGLVRDAVVAADIAQSRALWALRENISAAQAMEGVNIKHDISVPVSAIADFIATTDAALQDRFPGIRMVTFGHLGDGNLHYNVSPDEGAGDRELPDRQDDIHRLVHDAVVAHGGSISAEHGIGQLKRGELARYKSATELALMRTIKHAIDPCNIMNPGKVL